ncbi:MAG: protein BatD [Deltaproteobacteria bacterium]|nr:protein BatD [Deltaproteobacteria bacterium]
MTFGIPTPQAWAEVSVSASLDKNQATLEDEIYLTVTVSGTMASAEPVLPPMPAFKAIQSGTSSSIQIINGDVQTKKEFSYILIPRDEGSFTIDPITVFSGGHEYKSQPLSIRIGSASTASPVRPVPSPGAGPAGGGATGGQPTFPGGFPQPFEGEPGGDEETARTTEQREYWITAEVSNRQPYVNEQILYTFRFYTRVNVGSATLTVPEFQDFWSEEVVPEKKYYQTIGGQKYVVSEKVVALYPLKAGELTIPETSLRVEVPEEARSRFFNDSFFSFPSLRMKPKYLRAKPIALQVKPLPPDKPENFTNLVGQFGLSVNLSQPEIKMGDSAMLDVEISGRGNVKDGLLPFNAELPAFKVYDDRPAVDTVKSEAGIQGKKSFKKALVPTQSGEYSIPSFSVSYFDPQKGAYETLESPSLSLRVLPAEAERLNPVAAQTPSQTGTQSAIIPEDIATIHTDPGALETHRWGIGLKRCLAAGLFLPPLLFFGTLVFKWREEKMERNATATKSRLALRNFLGRAGRVSGRKKSEDEALAALTDSLRDYVGDRCGIYGRGLTVADITAVLTARGVTHDLTAELGRLMQRLESARYGGEIKERPLAQWVQEAKGLVRTIDRKVGKR